MEAIQVGPGSGSKVVSYILIFGAFAMLLANMIVTGISIGDQNTNQTLRKYVGLSIIPVVVSLVLLGIGLKMYFAANPGYLPYAALILSLAAIGASNMAVCISLIDKVYT
jgi:uncharacterized membrane protein YczE